MVSLLTHSQKWSKTFNLKSQGCLAHRASNTFLKILFFFFGTIPRAAFIDAIHCLFNVHYYLTLVCVKPRKTETIRENPELEAELF